MQPRSLWQEAECVSYQTSVLYGSRLVDWRVQQLPDIVDLQRAVVPTSRKRFAVRCELEREHPVRLVAHSLDLSEIGGIENLDRLVGAARRQKLAIGRVSQLQDRVFMGDERIHQRAALRSKRPDA